MSSVTKARSVLAVETRRAKRSISAESREAVADAKRQLVEANIAAYVERAIAGAPPLTPEQRDRLVLLLRGSV